MSEQGVRHRYDSLYGKEGYHEGWEIVSKPVKRFLDTYANQLVKGGKVLDLGAGQGRHTAELARRGYDAYGIDVSAEGLNQAQALLEKNNLSAHLTQGDFTKLPYKNDSFDAIINYATLQHVDEKGADKTFQEARRVLKRDGLFNFTAIASPKKGGSRHYSPDEIKQLAQRHNFEILEIPEPDETTDEKFENDVKRMQTVVLRKNL